MVIPNFLLISLKRDKISLVVLGSNADVASSHKRILGSKANALAIATLCFCPPLNSFGLFLALSVSPTSSSSSSTLFFIKSFLYPQTSKGNEIFSNTVFLLRRLKP